MTPMDDVVQRLVSAGMAPSAARDKGRLFESILADLPSPDAIRLFVPGRIEFLGKHTDYAGGKSLVGAIDRGICFAAIARNDRTVIVRDALRQLTATFDLGSDLAPLYGTWASYAMVVARRVARNFPGPLSGVEISFASDLSPAAGMSTSSALITGFFTIFAQLSQLGRHPAYVSQLGSPEQMAGYLGAIENGSSFRALAGDTGVGTFGGSQDHAAILLSEPRSLLLSRR